MTRASAAPVRIAGVRFRETEIPGAFVVELEPIEDDRGFFARTWARDELEAQGLRADLVQQSTAWNRRAGTVRGLHWQAEPHAETKLVRCVRGAIWDVIVDVRPDSAAYLNWLGVELTERNGLQLYVPEGVAHGYQTLADDTEATYAITAPYVPDAQRGARWDDPAFGIAWPEAPDRTISERDRAWPDFSPTAA
jgi:dTDP-4-dehydrorhamnose 3,5-epimerase